MKHALAILALALAACDTGPEPPAPPKPTAAPDSSASPIAPDREAGDQTAVYRVNPEESRADIIVRRGGQFEKMGHDHVITAHGIDGHVLLAQEGATGSRADLVVELGELTVDEAAARKEYQLATEPSDRDIARTGDNMHEKVLETERWPEARVAIGIIDQTETSARCEVTLQVKDRQHTFPIEVSLDYDDSDFRASGQFDLLQSDLGIEPFGVLGGMLSVRDRLEISFRIRATRVERIEP
jgi:hypothetical protein